MNSETQAKSTRRGQAKLLNQAANKLRELINITWGWDGDCGSVKLADEALDCLIEIRKRGLSPRANKVQREGEKTSK